MEGTRSNRPTELSYPPPPASVRVCGSVPVARSYLPLPIHDGHTGELIVPFLRPGRVAAKLGADGILLYLA